MADVFDMAQQFDALNLEQGLMAQRIKAEHAARLKPTGFCLDPTCDEPIPAPRLFCNADCERRHARMTHR